MRWQRSLRRFHADSFASLAQCGSCDGFSPSFEIFALFWGLLLFLGILAFIPRLHFWCCLFCSICLFSSSFSPPVASLVCFSCWPPSLLVRVWLWGPAWYSFIFEPHVSPSSHMLRSKEGYQICVSSLRFGSGLYDEAGFLGGSHMGVCGSVSCRGTLLVVPIYVCGVFSVAAELCILSSCWGWGWLLLSLFWCVCKAFPGAPAVFCYVSCSWLPFWGSTPS